MVSLDYIDSYYQSAHSPEETASFEKRMTEDPQFANEVAFYLAARQIVREDYAEESKKRFREIYATHKPAEQERPVRKLWYYTAAAAAVFAIIFGIFKFGFSHSPQQLAAHYVADNLQTLPVKMSAGSNAMQSSLNLYNQKKYQEALQGFEEIVQRNPGDFSARLDAGLSALQLGLYDKAIDYFSALQSESRFSNPALFYHALTLMKRNQTGDQDAAKKMLQQVVDERLEGESIAREWLR